MLLPSLRPPGSPLIRLPCCNRHCRRCHRVLLAACRWREPFLSVGHVLYEAEGAAMLRSFAVIMCSPPPLFWASALLTTAVPWLILDPVLMPISYHRLRWVQPLSVAVLFPTNALRSVGRSVGRAGGEMLDVECC